MNFCACCDEDLAIPIYTDRHGNDWCEWCHDVGDCALDKTCRKPWAIQHHDTEAKAKAEAAVMKAEMDEVLASIMATPRDSER